MTKRVAVALLIVMLLLCNCSGSGVADCDIDYSLNEDNTWWIFSLICETEG